MHAKPADGAGTVASPMRVKHQDDASVASSGPDLPVIGQTDRSDGPADSGKVMLELAGISKSFSGVRALSDVSLTCYAGEIHALVGENGAGKSTLIKVAAGSLRADSGTVTIDGVHLARPSAHRARQLGLLTAYQDTSLVPRLTARENLVLSFRGVHPLGRRLPHDEIDTLIERYDLPFSLDRRVSDLSPAARQLL